MDDLNPTVYYVDPKHLCPHGFGKAVYCDACERTLVKVERDKLSEMLRGMARRAVQRGRMLDETCRVEHKSRSEANRYRAALEQIKALGCEDVHRGIVDEECPISYTETDVGWCPPCTAAAALEEK